MQEVRWSTALLAAVLGAACTGCPPMLIATATTTAASVLADHRSMGQQAADLQTKAGIEQALGGYSTSLAARINVDVFLGRVMLTGIVADQRSRRRAAEVARGAAGGAEVFDDIEIGEGGLADTVGDVATNKALGVNLLTNEGLASQSLLHRVVNGTAFVMGEVQTESQVRTIRTTALNTGGVANVVTHITLEQ